MGEFIDLTPESLKTPEGAEKVRKAMELWHDWQARVANDSAAFIRALAGRD
jgi:hypothetical protein